MTKEQARVFVKAEKKKMTPAQIHENSRQIIDRLISQDFFYSADTVLTYVSYNQEVETHSFIDNCLSLGKTVLVPKVYGRDMKFHRIMALSELKPGKYGILEPDNTDICEPEQGLMIMPGLAFDKEHHRAGYGGGFYDRYLEQHPAFYKAAVAFSFQIVDHIETESYDLKPDCIITEQAVL